MRTPASEIGLATEQWNFALSQALVLDETPVEVLLTLVLHKAVVSVCNESGRRSRLKGFFPTHQEARL